MFGCTTAAAPSSWCLLKWNAANCLMLYEYIGNHDKRLDPSNSRYWLQAQCHLFTALWSTPICSTVWKYLCIQSHQEIRSFKLMLLAARAVSPFHSNMKHAHLFLCLELHIQFDSHIQRLDLSNSRYWLQMWCDSGTAQVDVTKITVTLCKLKTNWSPVIFKCRFVWNVYETYRILQ